MQENNHVPRASIDKRSKFTVIIPTRERADTLQYCLKTVVAQDYDNLEILVSDNFSCDNTEDVVRSFKDPRIIYKNTGKRVSMSHNWEFALSHINSGWVTILGDDDGLLPGALSKVSDIIKETGVLAIRSSVCSFMWPSLNNDSNGRLSVPLSSGYEIRNSMMWLGKVLKGHAKYPALPMLYNGGFVSINAIDRAKNRMGQFYRSLTPDVCSAVALAAVVNSYLYSKEPFAINGASKHSTGTFRYDESKHSPATKFECEDNISFHVSLPLDDNGKFPKLLEAIVYESYLQCEDLHRNVLNIDAAGQLFVFLMKAKKNDKNIRAWAQKFAEKHNLNFSKIESDASHRKLYWDIRSLAARILAAVNTYGSEFMGLKINDVYEASLVAGTIREIKVNQISYLLKKFKRKVLSAFQQSENSPPHSSEVH